MYRSLVVDTYKYSPPGVTDGFDPMAGTS